MIMAATKISPNALGTIMRARGRSALDTVMLIGLAVVVVGNVIAMVIEGGIIPPVLIATIAYLACAIVVATRWRWSMVFPLALCSLGIVSDFASGFPEYSLTHPSANYVAFVLFVIEYPLLIVVIVAAGLKLAQTLQHETPHAPEWMKPALGVWMILANGFAQVSGGLPSGLARLGVLTGIAFVLMSAVTLLVILLNWRDPSAAGRLGAILQQEPALIVIAIVLAVPLFLAFFAAVPLWLIGVGRRLLAIAAVAQGQSDRQPAHAGTAR
jgi:hypothetical protein